MKALVAAALLSLVSWQACELYLKGASLGLDHVTAFKTAANVEQPAWRRKAAAVQLGRITKQSVMELMDLSAMEGPVGVEARQQMLWIRELVERK